ncbi:MAG: hypothetical protein ACAH11_08120 [Sphingomonas sp.]
MRKMAMTAAAIAAMLCAGAAAAQTAKWRVLLGIPTVAVFATEAKGPMDQRTLSTFMMLPRVVGGIDSSTGDWTIDCKAKTALDHGGNAFLGTKDVGTLPSTTPDGPTSYLPDDESVAVLKLVAGYACEGTRYSEDNTVLADDAAARAYGNKLFGR